MEAPIAPTPESSPLHEVGTTAAAESGAPAGVAVASLHGPHVSAQHEATKSATPTAEGLRVEMLLEKVRVQAELLRAKDKQIELLQAQLAATKASGDAPSSSVKLGGSQETPMPTLRHSSDIQIASSSSSRPSSPIHHCSSSSPRSPSSTPPGSGSFRAQEVSGLMVDGAVAGLQELLAKYEQLEKRLAEFTAHAPKSQPLRKQPSGILRSRIQHKRIGSDAPNEVDEDRTEENELPPPLPSLPVLLQRRAPVADIRRKLEEEPSCLLEKDLGGQTPLHIACSIPNINVEVVKALITAGASVKDTDANGWTPLHFACMEKAHKDLVWLLISSGADAAAPNADGTRPFHYLVCRKAIEYDRETIDQIRGSILCLLKGGADINQPNRNGDTPLHLAALHDGYDVVQILLDSGADLTAKNLLGESVLHYAIMGVKKTIVEKLLDKGLDPRIPPTPTVPSPLQLAAKLGHKGKEIYNILRAKVSLLDMKDMTDEEKRAYRRNLSIEELILTEKEYIHDLKVLVRVFLDPIKRALNDDEQKVKILDEQEMRLIFGNVEEILHVSEALQEALDKEWTEALAARRAPNVGRIFLDNLQGLREYEKLCMHQQMATESLDKALGTAAERDDGNSTNSHAFSFRFRRKEGERSDFAIFCEEAKKNKDCRQLDIASFLIKPFQRVTKYPLLFREIMSYMEPSDPDFENLKNAQEEIGKMIAKANEKKRIVDTFEQLLEVQNRLILPAGTNLIKKGRAFVQEGRFQVSLNKDKYMKRVLFLFTDLLIVAQPSKKDKEVDRCLCLNSLALSDIVLSDIPDGVNEAGKIAKSAFSIQHKRDQLRMVAFAVNEEEKKDWMHMLSTRIASASENASDAKTSESGQVFINLQSGKGTVILGDLLRTSGRTPTEEPHASPVVFDMGNAKMSSSMIIRPSAVQRPMAAQKSSQSKDDQLGSSSSSTADNSSSMPSSSGWRPAKRSGGGSAPSKERPRGIGGVRPSPSPTITSPRS